MQGPAHNDPPIDPPPRRIFSRRLWRKLCFGLVYLLFLFVVGEVGVRLYWRMAAWVSPFHPRELISQRFYTELSPLIAGASSSDNPPQFDVLLLGGSVLHPLWGDIQVRLEQRLREAGLDGAKVYSLAKPAHTSRDSWIKYQYVERRFDLVLVYHGINEVRMNNCPPAMFREDYSHVAWYATVNGFSPGGVSDWVLLPFTLRYLWVSLGERFGGYVPRQRPRVDWYQYASAVRSKASFEKNIGAILERAQSRGEPVLLVTFAHCVPSEIPSTYAPRQMPGYAMPDFEGACPIELWGAWDDVVAGIDGHNQVLTQLANRYENATEFDVAKLMSHDTKLFCDICHFTQAGCQQFVENLVPVIVSQAQK